ncbi:MAG: RnfABCDGE type electron transport complex subunit D, partial [Candidatus Bathyarchaeota archaeon]
LLVTLVSVGVAVACDFLLSMVMGSKGPKNTSSAIVFGLIVALSYSLGEPTLMSTGTVYPVLAGGYEQYIYPALISALGLIVFKKIAGLAKRKYVNPAAIAKLLVLGLLFLPMITDVNVLIPTDHTQSINLQAPLTEELFGSTLITCYGDQNTALMRAMSAYSETGAFIPGVLLPEAAFNMVIAKYHGWIGGFSSILVIAIGLLLLAVSKGYFKWRVTLSYLVGTGVLAVIMGIIYGGDVILTDITFRLLFHLFMGSSIFLAFFMATDPATSPITHTGQIIFGVGLAILTMIIQVYTGFLGGSILALVIMNVTCPVLDRVGVPKARKERIACAVPPKARKFSEVQVTQCIRCGRCLYVCSSRLPTVSIKEAADKGDWARVKKLGVEYCQQCGTCSFVCPARIDLKGAMRAAKEKVQKS